MSGGDRPPTRGRTVLISGGALALLTLDVRCHGRVSRLEQDRLPSPPATAGPWRTVTQLGDRPALAGWTAIAAALAAARGGSPLRPVLSTALGVSTRYALMRWVGRERPPRERWLSHPEGASYPSRHATSAALGLVAVRRELPRSPVLTGAVSALVVLECWSRVRLGVHWPTDVVAGVLLAVLADAGGAVLIGATTGATS